MLAFLLVAVVVIVSPGPDFALTVHNTVARGRRSGMATSLGVVSGQLLWGVATAIGLSALLVASQPLFTALRFAGAAYLVWLGVQALRRRDHALAERRGSGFRQGFLSNAGNPKMAVFFTSLLPQFGGSLVGHSLLFSALTLLWLALVVRIGSAIHIPRVVDYVTGIALIGFGGLLATRRA